MSKLNRVYQRALFVAGYYGDRLPSVWLKRGGRKRHPTAMTGLNYVYGAMRNRWVMTISWRTAWRRQSWCFK